MEENKLAVICDFDGTITSIDVGHQVYSRFGDERWREINQRWRRGEISSKDCLIGEYSFIDADEQEVMEHVLEMEIDTGFIDLVKTCKNNDVPIAIASDGFDFYIHALLEKYGLSDIEVFCNNLAFNGRKVELSFPLYKKGCGVCGNCKKLHVQKFKNDCRKIIYIGDGLSDRFAARASDVIFAKGELMQYLMDNSVEFIKLIDLGDVNTWIIEVLAGDIELPVRADQVFTKSSSENGNHTVDPCKEEIAVLTKNSERPILSASRNQ